MCDVETTLRASIAVEKGKRGEPITREEIAALREYAIDGERDWIDRRVLVAVLDSYASSLPTE